MEEEKTLLDLLREELAEEIKSLHQLPQGSKEHSMAVKDISELYQALSKELDGTFKVEETNARLAMEEERFEAEKLETEKRFKADRVRLIKDIVLDASFKVADIVVRCLISRKTFNFYGNWLAEGFKFEETGTLSSPMFRGFTNNIKPPRLTP